MHPKQREHRQKKTQAQDEKSAQIEQQKTQIETLSAENEQNKKALSFLQQSEQEKTQATERADKAEKKLAELEAKYGIAEAKIDSTAASLHSCLEEKSMAESYCKDPLTGLDPQQSWDEI